MVVQQIRKARYLIDKLLLESVTDKTGRELLNNAWQYLYDQQNGIDWKDEWFDGTTFCPRNSETLAYLGFYSQQQS